MQERADTAQTILDNEVFKMAISDIYSRAERTLLTADIGSLTASAAHATMKAVIDLKSQLMQYVADDKMRRKFMKGDKA